MAVPLRFTLPWLGVTKPAAARSSGVQVYALASGQSRSGIDLGSDSVKSLRKPAVALVTLVPVLVPIANAYGIDLVHLGVIVVLNLMIGQLTPPSGVITFLTAQIAGSPLHAVFKEALPFTLALIAVLLIVTYVPLVSLWLPLLPFRHKAMR